VTGQSVCPHLLAGRLTLSSHCMWDLSLQSGAARSYTTTAAMLLGTLALWLTVGPTLA
jgi:hypothetical protein